MKWVLLALLVIFIGASSYQLLVVEKRGIVMPKNLFSGKVKAPGFEGGGEWLNSEPLNLPELLADNKLVLVDFWTYSCINCQRTLPFLKQWWEKYQDKGLVIVGVHSPEFEFEKDIENLKSAMERYGVEWPVVQDNEFKIWRAYANRYWPAKYLVTPDGYIVYEHFGEGEYEETEKIIRSELEGLGYDLAGTEVGTSPSGKRFLGQSPETYLGYIQGRFGNVQQLEPGKLKEYTISGKLMPDLAYLSGNWRVERELALSGVGAELVFVFTGGEVNLVMKPLESNKKVKVLIDGKLIKTVELKEADLYNLYKGEAIKGEMKLMFDEGIEVYAFTFGG